MRSKSVRSLRGLQRGWHFHVGGFSLRGGRFFKFLKVFGSAKVQLRQGERCRLAWRVSGRWCGVCTRWSYRSKIYLVCILLAY